MYDTNAAQSTLPPPSDRFLLLHAKVLAIGTILVMMIKTALVASTVAWFGSVGGVCKEAM